MVARIHPFSASGTFTAPPSKSFAQRALIISALFGEKTNVLNVGNSDDVNAVIGCLNALGADISPCENGVTVSKIHPDANEIYNFDCNESGATLRFMLPIVGALGLNSTFTGKGRLLFRPIDELIKAMNAHGCNVEKSENNIKTTGKLTGGEYVLSQNTSTQFISGLMLALSTLNEDSKITVAGEKPISGYILMTAELLKRANIGINIHNNIINITHFNDEKIMLENFVCEGDFSGAAPLLALGGAAGEVTAVGLGKNSLHPDGKILDFLIEIGAEVEVADSFIRVKKGALRPFTANAEACPDLIPVLAVLGAVCEGESKIYGADRLKYKESNRLSAIINLLTTANVKCFAKDNSLHVFGVKTPMSGFFDSFSDHRIAMAASVLAACFDGVSTISDADCVKKSYEDYFKDYIKLGGRTDVGI
ncbi:MAG: 3-phosphoshikimate 1-carboxyvinyltransferase [Clostridia bacterium]|nr:3-phosphoshikimate 1-carboxyvinyltransferase [Clostridia bacterium]